MNNFCKVTAYLGLKACDGESNISLQEQAFISHLNEFGISYGTKEEYQFRFDIFKKTDEKLEKINSDPANTFEVEHNQFSTWTDMEYNKLLGDRIDPEMENYPAT